MSDEPKLRHEGDWEKINHIEQIIVREFENESMALWAAEAIFQYVNENPSVSVHYIRRRMAEAWDEAYWQGVEDERTAEAVQMNVGPNRNNPYRDRE